MVEKSEITHETFIRVRYAETDTMGILHHAVYPVYFEEGRTELMRSYGTTYDAMEKSGVILPVYNVNVNFLRPAYYDDLLRLKTTLAEIKGVRLQFSYKLFNEKKILLATGEVTLIFTDAQSFKPVRPPLWFTELFS
jgi:acyl-CoA thioester hydrolase